MKLNTVMSMCKTNICILNTGINALQASQGLFAKILLATDMREFFKFPQGPLSHVLVKPLGTLKKLIKILIAQSER